MIKYSLICKDCKLTFDSWFASSNEYEKLKKQNFLNCHSCNSLKVEKNLMAPRLIAKKIDEKSKRELQKISNIKDKLKEYQSFIKKNFEYVGENFAYEARSIHYNKNKKNIFGKASIEDVKELKEEGIETSTIPWIEDKEN